MILLGFYFWPYGMYMVLGSYPQGRSIHHLLSCTPWYCTPTRFLFIAQKYHHQNISQWASFSSHIVYFQTCWLLPWFFIYIYFLLASSFCYLTKKQSVLMICNSKIFLNICFHSDFTCPTTHWLLNYEFLVERDKIFDIHNLYMHAYIHIYIHVSLKILIDYTQSSGNTWCIKYFSN